MSRRKHVEYARKAGAVSAEVRVKRTREAYSTMLPTIKKELRRGSTLKEIAQILNDMGYRTMRGTEFTGRNVGKIVRRYLGATEAQRS